MTNTTATRVAAATGFLAVALGAFGAHGLKKILAQNGTATIWETAVFYHFIHAVMLFVLAARKPLAAGPWWCFLAGILIFFRLALSAGGNGRELAGCHHTHRRNQFAGRLALAGVHRRPRKRLKRAGKAHCFPPPVVHDFPGGPN